MALQIREEFPFVVLTLCSADHRNLLTVETMQELCGALEQYACESRCEAVILAGNEEYFCFGGDLGNPSERTGQGIAAFSAALCAVHRAIASFPKITIAAVAGKTGGGGVSRVDACDLAVARKEASFEFPELHNGSAPMISFMGVRNSLPKKLCYEMMLAKPVPAERFLELGMINQIVPSGDVVAAAMEYWKSIPPCNLKAIALCKQYYMATQGMDYTQQLETGRHYLTSLLFGI